MLKHVLRYIKGTLNHCLSYKKSDKELKLIAFCDADWGSSTEDRKSITGYCFFLSESSAVVSWKSRKQQTVVLSTCEAEYMSMEESCKEALYLLQLLRDLCDTCFIPVTMNCDNQGAIALVHNPVKHSRSKHIDIRYHFIREHIQRNKLSLTYVKSDDNLADIFTKPCSKIKLMKFKDALFGQQ